MSRFQRIKAIVIGILLLLSSLLILIVPEEYYLLFTFIISIMLIVYAVRKLFYYFRMARHMVGGKAILYEAIIILDFGLFTSSLYDDHSLTILIYLLVIFIFTGFVDILRAFEAKKTGAKNWKFKFLTGLIMVIFALALVIVGLIFRNTAILKYGFCISVLFAAFRRFRVAFSKTAIVYIQ